MEAWLHELLCLDASEHIPAVPSRLPHPSECELYMVERDTLFSYHKVPRCPACSVEIRHPAECGVQLRPASEHTSRLLIQLLMRPGTLPQHGCLQTR